MPIDWKIFTQRPYVKSLSLEEQTRLYYIANEKSIQYRSRSGTGTTAAGFTNTRSLNFDGTDDRVDAGSSIGVIGTSTRTFSTWLKTSQTSGTQTVLGTRNINNDGWVIQISLNSIMFYNVKSPSNRISSTTNLTDGNWHNLIIVRAGSGNNKMYVDGVSQTLDNDSENRTNPQSSLNLLIGAGYNTGGVLYRFFDGEIDEVSIFDYALTEENVTSIYNGGVPGDIASLNPQLWYRFEEGSGTTAIDAGSGGNNGTINGATYSTDVPS